LRVCPPSTSAPDISRVFHEQLLDSMRASVIFVDRGLTILKWSRECEALTGLVASSVEGIRWDPGLIQLRDENYSLIPTENCPVINTIQRGSGQHLRLVVTNAQGEKVSVDAQVAPVCGADGCITGATLLMFDASSQVDLERQVECLYEKASQDGLTKIANRAELDRQHEALVRTHHERETSYSMIICDLDHFKHVNDTYGHQTGDEALVTFAALLKRFCRAGDLVARYGGEEFVLLCANCDNATATVRAEAVREAWAAKPQPMLNGKCLTCSFGVTELQAGDTAETMLRRADRALLQAKDSGRNTVVQLGCGRSGAAVPQKRRKGWLRWLQRKPTDKLLQRSLITASPLKVTVEKLRGFVADHAAEILEMEDTRLTLQVEGLPPELSRRSTDRPTPYLIELQFQEIQVPSERREEASDTRTLFQVAIRPKRERDRRRDDSDERVRQLLGSLKAYLMAQDYVSPDADGQQNTSAPPP
ncbi:MAG: GGDEF domain-containing protein, partial [Planctomycetota bacterium]|nr:GGDEF domain-containing protein [Planctomycetota bacterium]